MQLQVKAKTGEERMGKNRCLDDLNIFIGFKYLEVKFKALSCFRWCDAKPADSLKCH